MVILLGFDIIGTHTNKRTDRHIIRGNLTIQENPGKRLVIAIERHLLTYIGSVYSHPITGEWELYGLLEYPERSILVFALDNTNTYNAQVFDCISQITNPNYN